MALKNDSNPYVTRMLGLVLNKDKLASEEQMKIAHMICDGNSITSNETREKACLVLGLAIQNDQQISINVISFLNRFSFQQSNQFGYRLQEYVLCANAAWNSNYFLTKRTFDNLHWLIEETNNVHIQNWIMWAYATRVKYDAPSNLQQTKITLLEKMLSQNHVSWSVSYIIRKMTEHDDKQTEQVSEKIWNLLTEIIDCDNYDVGTYRNAYCALGNFFSSKYTTQVSSDCKQRVVDSLGKAIVAENLSKDILNNAVRALKHMIIDGYTINARISTKLKELIQDDNHSLNEDAKVILDMVNNNTDKQHTTDMPKKHYSHVTLEKIAASRTMTIDQSQESTIEPQVTFINLEMVTNMQDHRMNSNECDADMEYEPHVSTRGDHLSFFRDTVNEVKNLLRLTKQFKFLTKVDINYLCKKFSDHEKHYFSVMERHEVYQLIASAFQNSTKNGQHQSKVVMELLIHRLTDPESPLELVLTCSETFSEIVKHKQSIPPHILEKLADILLKIDDSAVRKNILNVLAINVEKTIHDINIPLETLENDLTQPNTCLATSYIFLRAVLTEDKKISLSTFQLMCNIVSWPLQEGYSIDGRRNCMATIAYSIKKMDMRESQVQTIQFCLTKAFEDHDEKIRSLALKTLCFYCEVECITHFQPRILNENLYRILTKEIENQFSEDLRNITSIYLQAAKKKRQLTNDVLTTISVLLKISPDFNIRQNAIWTLKYVTEKLDTILLPLAVLVNVEIALDDPELSIRTVAVDIFLKNWRKGHLYLFKKSQASITKLLTNKFHINVQKSTLSILQEISEKKHELSNDLIYLIAQFLFNPDLTMVTTAADILLSHVRNHTLSQNIINMVERTFHNRTNQNTLIKILRKCAFNQCILTEKTLLILGDLLFESNEEITRNIILSTLDFADRNQPLPEIINDLLRCEYYTKVLKNFESQTELEYAEQQLIAITSNGRRLSKGVLNSLQEFLANSELQSAILQIIVNITSNRQNLNNDMMNILSNLIFSTTSTTQVYVIKIFLNLVMNNQTPPNTFLNYLKNFILDTSVNTDVLLIYIILLERNMNSLDVDAISRIYKLLGNINELNLELNRNIAILLKQAIENGITSAEPELLIALLDSKDLLIQNNAIQMIHYMVKTNGCTLSDNMLSHLNQISMDEKVLEILENVSQTQQLPAHITERLDLVHCRDMHQDINLLKKLESAVSRGQLLLKHHFSELSNLLYSSNKVERMLASKILKIAALSNQTIPNQVIEVVATTTLDESMHPNTLQLLDKAFQCGWRASERTIEDLINLVTQSSTNVDMKEIARNILRKQNIVDFLIIEEYLSEISTSENKQVENLIGNLKIKIPVDKFSILYDKLMKQPSIRTESRILKVFQCAVYNNQSLSDDLLCCISDGLCRENKEIIVIILNKVMENGQVLPENVVHIVENAFLHDTTNSILHLISKLAYQYTLFQDDTIQLLIDKTKTYSDVSSIIEIIAEYQQLPLNIIRAYLEENLSNDDILKVRSSFIVLQHQIMKYYTEELFYLLTKVMLPHVVDENKLAAEISSIDEYLSIVRSLLSIEYFQADVFKMYPVKQWPRECLCIDLLARMKMEKNQLEVFTFYHNLSKLEEVNGYELYDEERDHILQLLIEKHAEMDMNKINQILILLQDVSIDILEFNSPNWYTNLIKSYVQKQIVKHFPEFGSTHAAANHINNLLLDIYSNYQSVEILTSILHSCSQPDQLITFLHLISNHQITSKEMNDALLLSTRTKTTLNKQLEMKIISKNLVKIWSGPADLLRQADDLLRKLFINWSFDNLSTILHNIQNTSKSLEQFIQYLTIINNYRIDDKLVEEIIHIFTIQQSDECIDEIYKLAINHCFPTTNTIEKSIQELIEEISELNRNNQIVSNFINENKLQDTFQTIQSVLLKESSLINITLPIDKWNESNIKEWSKQVQLNSNWAKQWENLSEIIAVIQRAIYLDSNYKIRHIQLMAVLLLLNSNDESRGRLAQIATGEGKSTIISILAIVKALQGLHVDIVTSSTILAQRDAKEKAKLYSMFNLSVSHNGDDDTVYTSGSKKCYTSSIVYGDVSHFQFDVLRDEFSLLNTRAKRPFSVVIIDEVDSMLIDENNKIARLADYMLGMEYLNPLLYGIWQAIKNLTDDEVVCKNTLVNKIKSVILGENPQITVPQHLRPFVLSQLSLWIENAFVARYRYELERHYTIKPDEQNINRITPIDYLNTGVIQSSTTWSDGLHQFLQLKHGLKLTPLNLTTNFLSNVGFFDRYKNKMYGLTGTLGSEDAKQLLCNVYSVDTIVVPRYKQIYHIELPSIIVNGEKEWIKTIVQSTVEEVRRNRAVLIICETRADAIAIFKQLRDKYLKVNLYTDNTDRNESNIVDNRAGGGDIIVATNLAGRGTDFKTSKEVEENGGLHVCLTFLPINPRVEQQAFGRTSRQGNRGTSQLILNIYDVIPRLPIYSESADEHSNLSIDNWQKIEYLRELCQKAETNQLKKILTEDIPEIKLKDELFRKFCELLHDLRQMDNDEYKLNSVKERWGLWLKDRDYRDRAKDSLITKIKKAGFQLIDDRSGSLYHAVSQQLQERIPDDKLEKQMIGHIIQNQRYYEDCLKNIDNDSRIFYIENTMMQALMRAIGINIVLFHSYEQLPTIYKRRNANKTIYLATDVDLSFYSFAVNDAENILNDMLARADQDEIVVNPNIIQNHNEDQLYVKLCNAFQQKDHLIDYSQFEQEIREQYQDGDKIIQNPFYHIAKADMLIEKTHKFTTRTKQFIKKVASFGFSKSIERKQALQCLDAAIQLDPIYSFTAYVNRAYLTIEQRNSPTYKENVIVDLTKARDQINNLILPVYHSMQLNLGNDNNEHLAHDELSKQLTIKTDIIQLYSSHIENAILKIEKSRKLVDITIFDKEKITTITKLERYKALELIGSYDSNKCKQFINYVLNHHKYKLSFHDLLVYKDIIKKDQAIKLIKLIKLMKKDYHNISINFQQIPTTIAKEVVQCCEKIVQHANLRVDYLNKEELFNLFDFVTDDERTIDVNITAKNLEQYRDIIQNINAIVIINTSIENGLKFSTNNNALDYLMNNVYQEIASITIPAANVQFFDALKIMSLDDISFSVIFNKLSLTKILNVIETVNKSISIEFTNFDIINAKKIIKIQKERNFLVCLNDLSYSETRQILEIFDPDEQDVNVIFKKIDENYLPNDKPEEELNELNKHGINKLIIINELTPIPWFSVMTIAALGTAQIIGGVLLSTFTCGIGFSLGASLIAEGVSDLYFALKGTISRNINWKDYAMQKAISLAICFLTLGASTVSQSFRAAEQFASKSTPQLAKQTWIQAKSFIQTSFTIIGEETIETTAKTSLRLACKKVAVMSIETGAREVLNYSADHILNNHLLTKIRLELADYIESSINEIMDKDSEYKLMLERIFFIDSYNQNHQWQYQIEQIAFNILNTCEEYINAAKSFAMGASNALLNHVKQNGGTPGKVWNITQKGLDVIKIIQQASKCTIFTKKFFHSFKNELKKLEEGMPELVELLSKEENIGLEAAKAIFLILKEHNIFNTDGSLNRDFFPEDQNENIIEKVITDEQIIDRSFSIKNLKAALQKIDFRINEEDYGSIVIKFFTRILHDAYQKSMLLKKIHKLLIDQMMAFIQGVFVAPLKNYIIRKVIQIVSDNLQRNLDENHATVQEQLEYQGALRYNNIILTKFIKDVQCGKIEMKSDAKEQFKRILQKPMKDRSQYENQIFKVLNNNQGGIVELHLISAVTGLKFSVIENKDSKEVVKHDGKIQLAYTQTISHEEDKTIVSSYWQPVGNHNSLNIEQRNNSLYDAVYAQIPNLFTSPAEIRIQVAEFMLTNPTYIAQILPAVNIINSNPNPIHRNKWLMEDGYFEISNTQIKPNLLYLQKSNSIGIRAVNAMKDLTDFINNYGEKITVAIDIGYRLFPRLIPREVVTMGNKFVVFNRRCTDIARRCNNVVGKCQKKAMIGALIELIRTGQIIISFCDELKS